MKIFYIIMLVTSILFSQDNRSFRTDDITPYPDQSVTSGIQYQYLGITKSPLSKVVRKVLLEEGTNTSCGYCAQYNPGIKQFMDQHPDSLVNVTYHVYWPGNNDPMYQANTTQIAQRINYIGINAVPRVDIDGIVKDVWPLTPSGLNNVFNQRQDALTNLDISVVDEMIGEDSIRATITVDILEELPTGNYKLRVYSLDRKIVYPYAPGNNGEKEFEYVFRRGYPDMSGTSIPLTVGTHEYTITYEREEIWGSGLIYTIAFVQNDNNKEILNADMSNFYYLPQSAPLASPQNNKVTESSSVILSWNEAVNADKYRLELSESENFTEYYHYSNLLSETTYNLGELGESKKLYWRVKAFSDSDSALYSEVWNFATPLNKPYNLDGEHLTDKISLNWNDFSEYETGFVIERAITQGIGIMFRELDTVNSNITTYDDNDISATGFYYYRIKAISDVSHSAYSDSVMYDLKVGVEEVDLAELTFTLDQNFPNPFNPVTNISFTIPVERNNKEASLIIYDMLGKEVEVLHQGELTSGKHQIQFTPENLTSGIYFYNLVSGEYSLTKKLVYLK
ncbi:MAG: hypothetical protein SCALA702_31150 [Melioribacteraceae bacterium]|nr:MAG: hypothetical protein SCALA702_31150 [Melioribacteraceae bacterium]